MDQRSKMLSGTEKLNQTNDRLQNAHSVAIQSEQIGTLYLHILLFILDDFLQCVSFFGIISNILFDRNKCVKFTSYPKTANYKNY